VRKERFNCYQSLHAAMFSFEDKSHPALAQLLKYHVIPEDEFRTSPGQ